MGIWSLTFITLCNCNIGGTALPLFRKVCRRMMKLQWKLAVQTPCKASPGFLQTEIHSVLCALLSFKNILRTLVVCTFSLLSLWCQVFKCSTRKRKNTHARWSGEQCTVTTFLNQIFEESEQFSANPMKVGERQTYLILQISLWIIYCFTKTTYANNIVISSAVLTHVWLKRYVGRTQETWL